MTLKKPKPIRKKLKTRLAVGRSKTTKDLLEKLRQRRLKLKAK